MFFHDVNDHDFIELLAAMPDSPALTRAHLVGGFGVIVDSDDPTAWWHALIRDRDEQGAAKAVAQLIIKKGGTRVLSLIKADVGGRHIVPRADDSKLARLLFDESLEGSLVDQETLRAIVCEYYDETQMVIDDEEDELPEPEDEFDPEDAEEDDEDIDNGPSLLDMISGTPRPSAQRGAPWTLERVQHPSKGFLTVPDRWKEKDLEDFLWSKWETIDFGFDRPIYLVGKQKRLSEGTSDRVDLLARGRSGEHIAIELKIVEARRGDYTQLTSYMGNLQSSGVPADKVRGVLIAPEFSEKVLSSAAIEPRVTLLRFNKGL
ncbi:endonuclease NucS domain-containing protein [Candidatus Palauibacter irciniicola]|uniref:endonuclease NucS domain-containing protein n=1 Tax=Candidatus Palauibacter irciniicola TaxID=3056733 RepID=UPI003B011B43